MRTLSRGLAASLLLLSAACADDAARTTLPDPQPAPLPLGVYEIAVTGIGGGEMQSTIRPAKAAADGGPSHTLSPVASSIVFEQVSSSSFTEGTRADGGQRYISFTYRVRNATGATLNNLTMLMVSRASTIAGTPLSPHSSSSTAPTPIRRSPRSWCPLGPSGCAVTSSPCRGSIPTCCRC